MPTSPRIWPSPQFETKLNAGDIASLEMKTRSDEIVGEFKADAVISGANTSFRTVYPPEYEDELTNDDHRSGC